MNLQHKQFTGHLKSWDDKELVIEHFISTETQDSCGDIMLAGGMKIRGKPVVLFQHGLDPKFGNEPIAKVLDIRVGEHDGKKGLIAKTQYFNGEGLTPPDNTGRRLYEKAKDGTMPNWSIGFNSVKEHPVKGGRCVDEWDLHEYSQVAVGMNSEACTLPGGVQEMKFVIVKNIPDGFADEKAFLDATEEFEYDDAPEMDCRDGECKTISAKPYANEHACRINDPGKFSKFRRQNAARDHDGKKYDVIYGQLKGSDKWDEQAYRYPKDTWSAEAAAAHCKSHDGSFEAAKALPSSERKEMATHKRAHKAIHALHRELINDLKDAAESDDLIKDGAESLADEALDEFEDCASPHVEKYIKAVRAMKDDEAFDDEEAVRDLETEDGDDAAESKARKGTSDYSSARDASTEAADATDAVEDEDDHKEAAALHRVAAKGHRALARDAEDEDVKRAHRDLADAHNDMADAHDDCKDGLDTGDIRDCLDDLDEEYEDDLKEFACKGFRTHHKALKGDLDEMIKGIRGHKGKKATVPRHAADECLKAHREAALPHAVEYVKAWHARAKASEDEDAMSEMERKPILKRIYLSMTKTDKESLLKALYHPPKTVPSVPAQKSPTAQEKVFRVSTPDPEPTLKIMADEKPEPTVPADTVKVIMDSVAEKIKTTITSELRRAAGRVTQ